MRTCMTIYGWPTQLYNHHWFFYHVSQLQGTMASCPRDRKICCRSDTKACHRLMLMPIYLQYLSFFLPRPFVQGLFHKAIATASLSTHLCLRQKMWENVLDRQIFKLILYTVLKYYSSCSNMSAMLHSTHHVRSQWIDGPLLMLQYFPCIFSFAAQGSDSPRGIPTIDNRKCVPVRNSWCCMHGPGVLVPTVGTWPPPSKRPSVDTWNVLNLCVFPVCVVAS